MWPQLLNFKNSRDKAAPRIIPLSARVFYPPTVVNNSCPSKPGTPGLRKKSFKILILD